MVNVTIILNFDKGDIMTIYLKATDIQLTINDKKIALPILNDSESKFNLSLGLGGGFDHFINVKIKFCLLNTKENIKFVQAWHKKTSKNKSDTGLINNLKLDFHNKNIITSHRAYLWPDIELAENNIPEGCFQVDFLCFDIGICNV